MDAIFPAGTDIRDWHDAGFNQFQGLIDLMCVTSFPFSNSSIAGTLLGVGAKAQWAILY
jgi:hypothetical protein